MHRLHNLDHAESEHFHITPRDEEREERWSQQSTENKNQVSNN